MVDSPSKRSASGVSGFKNATSPRTDKLEGTSVSKLGSLLTIRVKKGTSVEKFEFNPKIVLLTDSCPKLDFCVNGCSDILKMVPPKRNLSENLCSTFAPKNRRVC